MLPKFLVAKSPLQQVPSGPGAHLGVFARENAHMSLSVACRFLPGRPKWPWMEFDARVRNWPAGRA
eukprot:4530655-Alexandrium_andersonii.AAC.1